MSSKNLIINKSCKSCTAVFSSSFLEDEIYCLNCRDDEGTAEGYSSSRDYDDIVNNTSRTLPVFYD